MGRDDDMADPPRGGVGGASGGGARAKRSAVSNSGLKYDPAMAANHHHITHHRPHEQQHHTQVYAPLRDYDTASAYASHTLRYTTEESTTLGTNKRKRVKKERDDDWAPPPPPPPPPSSSVVYGSNATERAMHMTMPTILHRSSSASAVTTAPPPPLPMPYEVAYTGHPESGGSHTIFSESPVVIESFAETERRRAAAAAAASASASTNADLSQLIHTDQPASATSTPKNKSNGVGVLWNGRAVSSGTMSVYDVFFPSASRTKEGGSVTSTRNGARESKRRRRNNGEAAAERSTTRGSNRRSASAAVDDSLDVEMLRFTVDPFKLIPQGLVDRIDARLRPTVVYTLIANHVENWIKRAGFDDQIFLQEITTLLNVYYPCSHPTILDDVLVAFVFKRPELMDRMVTSIIERLQKTGESATPTKYPVIEAFTRRCGLTQRGGILRKDQARHDLACLTVLRLLLERNTEKFMLSPWIASCASFCSDAVLNSMWAALLRPIISTGKMDVDGWRVRDHLDQVFELLREEKQLLRYAGDDLCTLSMTLITKIVHDEIYSDLRGAPVAREAFEIVFGRSNNCARLVETWLAAEQRDNASREDAIRKVLRLTIDNCARLSVKKTNWFIRHWLDFVLSTSTSKIFEELIVEHAGLLLGGVDKTEMDEAQGAVPSTNGNGHQGENGNDPSKVVVIGNISSHEKHAEAGVVAQVNLFLDSLRAVPENVGATIVKAWSERWCIADVFVPWSYVWGVVSSAIAIDEVSSSTITSPVDAAFRDFACRLAKDYVENLLRREDAARFLSRIVRLVNATIQQLPKGSSSALLESVFEAISSLRKSSPLAEKVYSVIATTLAGQISRSIQVRGETIDSMRPPRPRVALLHAVDSFVTRQDAVGRLVRDQLIQRRRVGKIILEVLQDGDDAEAWAAVKIMGNAVAGTHEGYVSQNLWTTSAIEAVVALGYRVRFPATRGSAIKLLNALSLRDVEDRNALLWAVLRLCTTYCCGCTGPSRMVQSHLQFSKAAVDFADLTKLMLKRAPQDIFAAVGDFIQQQIRSCGPTQARWNVYLVLVLDRVVQLGWGLVASSPKLVHLVLSPFEAIYLSTRVEGQIAQLRVLKSLCVVLLAESSTRRPKYKEMSSWLPVARTLMSDQLTLKLKSIGSQSGCLTTVALARSIAVLCDDIKQTIEGKVYC